MKPSLDAYTVALPWYEREDFDRLWELSDDHMMPPAIMIFGEKPR